MKRSIIGLISVTLLAILAMGCGFRRGDGAQGRPATTGSATSADGAGAVGTTPIATLIGAGQEGSMSSSGSGAAATPGASSQKPGDGLDAAGQGTAATGEAAAEPQGSDVPTVPSKWLVYSDTTLSFSLSYPDSYVRLAEPASLSSVAPNLVQRVRFQDRQLATGETADLELPQFTVEVFENTAGLTLEQWLDANTPSSSFRSTVAVGDHQGYQVTLNTMLAPNHFYYVADSAYVYRITPLGPHSEAMLASLKIGS